MICYKDMTFCNFWKDCAKGAVCARALTPQVVKSAGDWWSWDGGIPEQAPICRFTDKPDCMEPTPDPP